MHIHRSSSPLIQRTPSPAPIAAASTTTASTVNNKHPFWIDGCEREFEMYKIEPNGEIFSPVENSMTGLKTAFPNATGAPKGYGFKGKDTIGKFHLEAKSPLLDADKCGLPHNFPRGSYQPVYITCEVERSKTLNPIQRFASALVRHRHEAASEERLLEKKEEKTERKLQGLLHVEKNQVYVAPSKKFINALKTPAAYLIHEYAIKDNALHKSHGITARDTPPYTPALPPRQYIQFRSPTTSDSPQ